MQPQLKASVKPKSFSLLMTLLTALCTLAVLFVSDIFLPIAAGIYAVLFLYDRRKVLSGALFAVAILLSAFLGVTSVLTAVALFFSGALCAVLYRAGTDKSFSVLCLTVFYLLYLFASLYAIAAAEVGSVSSEAVFGFYSDAIGTAREEFVKTVTSLTTAMTDGTSVFLMTAEQAEELFLSMTSLIFAFFAIFAFCMTGILYKVFSRIALSFDAEPIRLVRYRFAPSPVFAGFYAVLFLLSLFLSGTEGSLAVALNNLFYIFMAVFAYVGIRFVLFALSRSRRRGLGTVLLIFFLLFANLMALELLSFFGVFFTFMSRRHPPHAEP